MPQRKAAVCTGASHRAKNSGVTAVTVPGVGHAPTLMEPVAAAALWDFLDDIKRGEA